MEQLNDFSLQKNARFTGIMFLFCLIFPVFNGIFFLFKLNIAGDVIATANNIIKNGLLFRFAIINGIIVALGGIILALSLYNLFKSINKNFALFALLSKIIEAVLIIVIEVLGFISLLIINEKEFLMAFSYEQVWIPVGYFLNVHTSLVASFPMFFLGLGLITFNYLFYKSRYIPGILAFFGIISYTLISTFSIILILLPDLEIIKLIQIICWTPSVIFELIIGLWLLIKGINLKN